MYDRCIQYNKEFLNDVSYDSFRDRCIGTLQELKNIQHLIFQMTFLEKGTDMKTMPFSEMKLKIKACMSFHTNYTGIENYMLKYRILSYCLILFNYLYICLFLQNLEAGFSEMRNELQSRDALWRRIQLECQQLHTELLKIREYKDMQEIQIKYVC